MIDYPVRALEEIIRRKMTEGNMYRILMSVKHFFVNKKKLKLIVSNIHYEYAKIVIQEFLGLLIERATGCH